MALPNILLKYSDLISLVLTRQDISVCKTCLMSVYQSDLDKTPQCLFIWLHSQYYLQVHIYNTDSFGSCGPFNHLTALFYKNILSLLHNPQLLANRHLIRLNHDHNRFVIMALPSLDNWVKLYPLLQLNADKETKKFIYGLRTNTDYEIRVRCKMKGFMNFSNFSDSLMINIPATGRKKAQHLYKQFISIIQFLIS